MRERWGVSGPPTCGDGRVIVGGAVIPSNNNRYYYIKLTL